MGTGMSREDVDKRKKAFKDVQDQEVFTRDWAPEEPGFEFGRGKRKQRRSEKVEVDESHENPKERAERAEEGSAFHTFTSEAPRNERTPNMSRNERTPNMSSGKDLSETLVHDFDFRKKSNPCTILKANPQEHSYVSKLAICVANGTLIPLAVWKVWRMSWDFGDFFFWWMWGEYMIGSTLIIYASSYWIQVYRLVKEYYANANQVHELGIVETAHGNALDVRLGFPFGHSAHFQVLLDENLKHNRVIQFNPDGLSTLNLQNLPPKYINPSALVFNLPAMLPFIIPPEDPTNKRQPVKLTSDGFVPVKKLEKLLEDERSVLTIYPHGFDSVAQQQFLFVSVKGKKLYVVKAKCWLQQKPFVEGHYAELGDKCQLKCADCKSNEVDALKDNVEWRVNEQGVVEVKIQSGFLRNPLPREGTDLRTNMDFYYTNLFRLMHPEVPTKMEQVFLVGDFQRFPPWEKKHTPTGSIRFQ